MTIFVSIASYRDPEIIPTIEDCIANAYHPDDLRFGICWQHADKDVELPMLNDPRFRIIDVNWRESQGVCWARAEAMKLWRGEDYFLQIDSHTRLIEAGMPAWLYIPDRQIALSRSSQPTVRNIYQATR